MSPIRNILLVTLEPISQNMAGPAIRCLEMGKALSNEFNVTIFTPHKTTQPLPGLSGSQLTLASGLSKQDLLRLAKDQDILVIQANVLKPYPELAEFNKYLVVDLYDPYLFTLHVQYELEPYTASSSFRMMHQILEKHMVSADFAMCASERQRDYWLGRFCALGRIDHRLYKLDPSLRKLIDVVPFGLPPSPPKSQGAGFRKLIPKLSKDDQIILWGGGIWDWFDPLTIISAMLQVKQSVPSAKLVFLGAKSPNPQVPEMTMVQRAKELAGKLDLMDKEIFFLNDWVAYEDRANYLLDADIAVSAHFDLPETRFSFRTRILDYLWANLPVLTTGGDSLSDLIAANGAGIVLPYGDVNAWRDALVKMLTDNDYRQRCREASRRLAVSFTWDKTTNPLRSFCQRPHHLPKHIRVKMPTAIERARAVYARGGKELVLKRASQLIAEFLN